MSTQVYRERHSMDRIMVGVSGEYFVAAELSRLGYVASVTLRNTQSIDILAANTDATRSVVIQVKTNRGKKKKWMVGQKAEDNWSKTLFYVFVNLNGLDQRPDYHVVPSKVVARYITRTHQEWLEKPDRAGKPHRNSKRRHFKDPLNTYRDRWDLLGL